MPIRPAAAISAPHRISERGPSPSRGIRPHCAPSVATAPAIITIAIGPSEPHGAQVQPVDDEEADAGQRRGLGVAGDHPGDDPRAGLADPSSSAASAGAAAVAATTLAPVGVVASDGIAHRRAMADAAPGAVVGQPQDDRHERPRAAMSAKANRGPARPTSGSTNNGATAGPMMVPRPNEEDSADSAATRPLRRVLEAR